MELLFLVAFLSTPEASSRLVAFLSTPEASSTLTVSRLPKVLARIKAVFPPCDNSQIEGGTHNKGQGPGGTHKGQGPGGTDKGQGPGGTHNKGQGPGGTHNKGQGPGGTHTWWHCLYYDDGHHKQNNEWD